MLGLLIIFSICSILAAVWVVVARNLVHACIGFGAFALGFAAIYILLGFEFIGLVQILLYVGAVVILFLFVLVLVTGVMERRISRFVKQWYFVWVIACGFACLVSTSILTTKWPIKIYTPNFAHFSIELLNKYPLQFELISVLLLVSMVGAIVLAGKGR